MEIQKGDIVQSSAGRDKGLYFFVFEISEDFTLLADGDMRKIENPKRKKLKHLRFYSRPDSKIRQKLESGGQIHNAELRKAIKQLAQQV